MAIYIPYPVIDMVKTGENIKCLRKDRDISVIELQHFLGLTNPQAVYQWQKGISLPTVDHLCALSYLFGVPMNDILVLKENPTGNCSEERCPLKKAMMKKMMLLMAA